MTGRHRGLKRKLRAGYTEHCHDISVLCAVSHILSVGRRLMCRHSYFSLLDVLHCNARHIFIVECGILRAAFSALCVYSTFGHHSHPWATFVPNFVCVAGPVAELAHGEKSHTQSCHSVTNSAYLMARNRSFRCGKALQSVTL